MKQTFLFVFLFFLLSAVKLSAAIQYSLQSGTGEAYFSVDRQSTVYVDVKKLSDGKNIDLGASVISNIGYYYYDDVSSYRSRGKYGYDGRNEQSNRPGRPGTAAGSSVSSSQTPALHYGDMKSGRLGEFKPGDKIVFWVETTSANGEKSTFTTYSPTAQDKDLWMLGTFGDSVVFNWGDFGVDYGKKSQASINPAGFEFSITTRGTNPPSGQPLPGIIATLLVGFATFVYLKKRKKLYEAR